MPRIRQNEKIYAEKDFLAEVEMRKVMTGIKTDRELASALNMSPAAYCRRKKDLDTLTVCELRNIVKKLGMKPTSVLGLLGLKAKDLLG